MPSLARLDEGQRLQPQADACLVVGIGEDPYRFHYVSLGVGVSPFHEMTLSHGHEGIGEVKHVA